MTDAGEWRTHQPGKTATLNAEALEAIWREDTHCTGENPVTSAEDFPFPIASAPAEAAPRPPTPAPGFSHDVVFYEDDDFLCDTISRHLIDALSNGESVIVIATAAHRAAFAVRLAAAGFDRDALEETGALRMLDARDTLAAFMAGGSPDEALFLHNVGSEFKQQRVRRPHATTRAYGEMVNLLMEDGLPFAALHLEEMWNRLAHSFHFSLRCAYAMGSFRNEAEARCFQAVCQQHTHVIPAESYSRAKDDDARSRAIAALQQRAQSLEAEVERRKESERQLSVAQAESNRLLACEQLARAEADEAMRLKEQFLAVLSHELRTPLNAILGWTQIAGTSRHDALTRQRALEVIERNALTEARLIDDLLDVSSMVSGRLALHSDFVDLHAVIEGAAEAVRQAARAKRIDLRLRLEATDCIVSGDRNRLQQVVWNLLTNAIKFTPQTGVVEMRLERTQGHAHLSVHDTGRGITEALLPQIFELFRQGDSGRARQPGLGLGLALVRYLVEAHGGTVRAESAGLGQGSAFTVRLPIAAAPSSVAMA